MPDQPAAMLTMSQIAELAGTQPSAVSNWRRRFEDFPRPVHRGPDGRDLFSLNEIEAWLRAHDRLAVDEGYERALFHALALVQGRASSDEGFELVAATLALLDQAAVLDRTLDSPARLVDDLERRNPDLRDVFSGFAELNVTIAANLLTVLREIPPSARSQAFEEVLARRHRFVETRTNDDLTQLLVQLSGPGSSYLDPAVGEGGTLAAAAAASSGNPRIFGQEVNERAWRIAKQRFLLHRIRADIVRGDSMLDDAFPTLQADVILCDPPYGMPNPLRSAVPSGGRGMNLLQVKTADYLWLDHAARHISPGGRASVVLPTASLSRHGPEADFRTDLLRRGTVEAVISLPAGIAERTGIPLTVWILRAPTMPAEPPNVLIADAAAANPNPKSPDSDLVRWTAGTVSRWRRTKRLRDRDAEFATSVRVLDLLAANADLSPARWILPKVRVDVANTRRELSEALTRLAESRDQIIAPVDGQPEGSTRVKWVPIRDLVDADLASVVRGVRVSPEDCLRSGNRAIRTKDVARDLEPVEPCYVDLRKMSPAPTLTEPGDIVVSPASGKLRAVIDLDGGQVLVHPVQGLRLKRGWLDSRVAAAFIESPRNRRFATGLSYGYARIDLRELELPALARPLADRIRQQLDQLRAAEETAQLVASAARDLRNAITHLGSDLDGAE